jgi:hypothetical protein
METLYQTAPQFAYTLLANKIKKGQFDTSEITSAGAMILQVWEAVLAA